MDSLLYSPFLHNMLTDPSANCLNSLIYRRLVGYVKRDVEQGIEICGFALLKFILHLMEINSTSNCKLQILKFLEL